MVHTYVQQGRVYHGITHVASVLPTRTSHVMQARATTHDFLYNGDDSDADADADAEEDAPTPIQATYTERTASTIQQDVAWIPTSRMTWRIGADTTPRTWSDTHVRPIAIAAATRSQSHAAFSTPPVPMFDAVTPIVTSDADADDITSTSTSAQLVRGMSDVEPSTATATTTTTVIATTTAPSTSSAQR